MVIMLDFAVIIAMGFPSVTGELFDAVWLMPPVYPFHR